MPNQIFETTTSELERHVGDILAVGITRKALKKYGYSEEGVTLAQMQTALRKHVGPALVSFMSQDTARTLIRQIEKKIARGV